MIRRSLTSLIFSFFLIQGGSAWPFDKDCFLDASIRSLPLIYGIVSLALCPDEHKYSLYEDRVPCYSKQSLDQFKILLWSALPMGFFLSLIVPPAWINGFKQVLAYVKILGKKCKKNSEISDEERDESAHELEQNHPEIPLLKNREHLVSLLFLSGYSFLVTLNIAHVCSAQGRLDAQENVDCLSNEFLDDVHSDVIRLAIGSILASLLKPTCQMINKIVKFCKSYKNSSPIDLEISQL